MAVLDKANAASPLNPIPAAADPDKSVKIETPKEDNNFDLKTFADDKAESKTDSAKEPEKKEEIKEEPKEQESKRFALLAKKEKVLYSKSQEIKQREENLNQKLNAVENFEKFKRQVKDNPMLALEELGVTYNQITDYVLQGKMPNKTEFEITELREEINALRREREDRDKKEEASRKSAAQVNVKETIDAFHQEIGDYISSHTDKYELASIYKQQAVNLAYQKVEDHFIKTKRVLSHEEALGLVEAEMEKEAERVMSAKKFQARVQPQPLKEERKPQPGSQQTLSNQMTSSAPSFLPAKTEHDRMKRAFAALK